MSRTTDIIEYIYQNKDIIEPLMNYANMIYDTPTDFTKEEYQSVVASFDFNKNIMREVVR